MKKPREHFYILASAENTVVEKRDPRVPALFKTVSDAYRARRQYDRSMKPVKVYIALPEEIAR